MATVKNLPVTLEDQKNINRYSLLIYKTNKLNRQLDDANLTASNQAEALEELDTLELEHDDLSTLFIPVKLGNALFHLPFELAKEEASKAKMLASATAERLEVERTKNTAEMADLKKRLESKFGDSIRLE